MTGFWLVSYIVLWLIVIGEGLVILALAREIEESHKKLDSLHRDLSKTDSDNK
jgi:hypothetical protein